MKKINNHLAGNMILAAFLALGSLAITTSCSKETQTNGQEVTKEDAQIIVRIGGITDGGTINTMAKNGKSIASRSSLELTQGNGFDAIVGFDNNVPSTSALSERPSVRASNGSKAAVIPMDDQVKYRLFLYKKNGANYTFDKSIEFASGTEQAVPVSGGATYKWVAVSYNSATDAVPDRGTNDNFILPANKDVLYAKSSSDVTIGSTTVPISIDFKRLYARVAIEVNTKGMFAPINSATINVTGATTRSGTIDLNTGNFVGPLVDNAAPTINYSNFSDVPASGGQQKVAYYYTATDGTTPSNLTVSVSNLKIQIDNSTERDFGVTPLNRTRSLTPEAGKSHRFLVALAETALTDANGTKWGRSNLYYRNGYNPYRFYHTNPYNPNMNESFFAFRGHLPRTFAKTDPAQQKDPCSLVYPAGLWKTPTNANLNGLVSNSGLLDGLLGGILNVLIPTPGTNGASFGTNYIEYQSVTGSNSTVYPEAANRLRFPYNGSALAISVVSGLVDLNLGHLGKAANFWTSDRLLETELLSLGIGAGAWSYMGYTAPAGGVLPPRPERAIGSRGAGILNINALGLGVIESPFMNVRCVRDVNWNPNATGYNPEPNL